MAVVEEAADFGGGNFLREAGRRFPASMLWARGFAWQRGSSPLGNIVCMRSERSRKIDPGGGSEPARV